MAHLNIDGRKRNYIFLVFSLISIIIIFAAQSSAVDQNEKLLAEYRNYNSAKTLMMQKKVDQAEKIYTALFEKYPTSFSILWEYGYCLANTGNPAKGSEYMEQAMKLSPVIKTFQKNLFEYGQVLFQLGNYNRAETYFRESKKYSTIPELNMMADQYIEQIQREKK